MNHFVMGVFDNLLEECLFVMLHENMYISHLIVHASHVKKSRLRRKNRDATREGSYEGCFSKGKLKIQNKPKFKKMFPNKVRSYFPKDCKYRIFNTRSQGLRSGGSQSENIVFSILA